LTSDKWPAPKKPQTGHQPTVEQQNQIETLRKKVAQTAAKLRLSPQLIAPKAVLTSIVLRKLDSPKKLTDSGLITGWQAELVTPILEEIFKGENRAGRSLTEDDFL